MIFSIDPPSRPEPKWVRFEDTVVGDIFCRYDDYDDVVDCCDYAKLYLALSCKVRKANAPRSDTTVYEAVRLKDSELIEMEDHELVHVFEDYDCVIRPEV